MIDSLESFWRDVGTAARCSLVVALAALSGHLVALTGVAFTGPFAAYFVLHLAVMGLGFGLMIRLFLRGRATPAPRRPLPRTLVWGAVTCGVYLVAWFIGLFAYYGEGHAEARTADYVWVQGSAVVHPLTASQYNRFNANIAAVFSAAWLSAGLVLALWHGSLDLRRRTSDPSARAA